MALIKKLACAVLLSTTIASAASATNLTSNDWHMSSTLGFGLRYINDQVMTNTNFGGAMELGLSAYKYNNDKTFYYGAQTFVNNAWDARFNSVNNASNSTTAALVVHNSASLDFLALGGKNINPDWSAEIGAGAQVSWVNWLASPQQASDKIRVLPKLRVSLNRKLSETASLFFSINQAFNHYGSLRCVSGSENCFNDEGFVSVTDAKIGISIKVS